MAVALLLAGCPRNVAPPLPYDPENVKQLREAVDEYELE
jgi:hypothetical protein